MAKQKKYTREIAEWVSQVRYEDIPEEVIGEAKNQTLSVLGAVYAGALHEPAGRVGKCLEEMSGDGPCTFLPGGKKGDLQSVLIANLARSIALDYDDYMIAGHTGHSSVLVPLALAETLPASGKDVLLAQVIANEVASRIGAAVMVGPLNGQMWSFIHAAGAACAAARMMGLDYKQTLSALGLALSQPGYGLVAGFMGSDAKLLTAGTAAANGALSARLAAEGVQGFPDILEHSRGFVEAFSFTPLLPILSSLGYTWLSNTLSYKIYPGCAYMDALLDATLDIVQREQPDPEDIYRVDIHASLLTVKMDDLARPFVRYENSSPVTLNFYAPYNVAAALIDRELTPVQLTPNRIRDSEVWRLARRVRTHHDIQLTSRILDETARIIDVRYLLKGINWKTLAGIMKQIGPPNLGQMSSAKPTHEVVRDAIGMFGRAFTKHAETREGEFVPDDIQKFRMNFGARVKVLLKNGKTFECEQQVPYGAAGRPLEEKRIEVIRKFRQEATMLITERAAGYLVNKIANFEAMTNSDLRKFMQICVGAVEPIRESAEAAGL
ncbi:MAG: MmgE/PrpD family protein [bacterium]